MRLNHREMEKTTAEPKKPLRNAKNGSEMQHNGVMFHSAPVFCIPLQSFRNHPKNTAFYQLEWQHRRGVMFVARFFSSLLKF